MRGMLAAVALGVLGAGEAGAATLNYVYVAEEFVCDPTNFCASSPYEFPEPDFSGTLTIHEALLPTGSVAGATLLIETDTSGVRTTTFTSGGLSYQTVSASQPAYMDFGGSLAGMFATLSYGFQDTYQWTFDASGQIVSWTAFNTTGSPFNDATSDSLYGDSVGSGWQAAPGEWVMVAAVPLPASGVILLGALGAGLVLRPRRPA